MDAIDFLLRWALIAFYICVVLEALFINLVFRRPYDWRMAIVSAIDGLVRQLLVNRFIPIGIELPLLFLAYRYHIDLAPENQILRVGFAFLLIDFFHYWLHLASHRTRWMWATHSVHHAPNEMTLSLSLRFGITGQISGFGLLAVPLIWLGFPPREFLAAVGLFFTYMLWLHAAWIPKLGCLERVLITPSRHRVHHAVNPEYLDNNFGGVLVVWDWLFGTLRQERDETPCRYGLVEPLTSYNLLRVEFHEWAQMFRDVKSGRSLSDKLHFMFGPPGWRPVGTRPHSEAPLPLRESLRTAE